MTIVPIPRDDAGLHRLQESNAARAAGAVAPVTAIPNLEKRPAEPAAADRPRARQPNRRRTDRRHQQRRWARHAVLLDTRLQHERRRGERRGASDDAGVADASRARPARRLDVLA